MIPRMGKGWTLLKKVDPEVSKALQGELKRQNENLELIASENFVSRAVLEAQASVLTNKYAEGYPAETVLRRLRIRRSGGEPGYREGPAAFWSRICERPTPLRVPGQHGGPLCRPSTRRRHLGHGPVPWRPFNPRQPGQFFRTFFRVDFYGVERETHRIDYQQVAELAEKHRPKLIIAGASAYPRTIDFEAFSQNCPKVKAFLMVDMAHIAGLVAAGSILLLSRRPILLPRPPIRPYGDLGEE